MYDMIPEGVATPHSAMPSARRGLQGNGGGAVASVSPSVKWEQGP